MFGKICYVYKPFFSIEANGATPSDQTPSQLVSSPSISLREEVSLFQKKNQNIHLFLKQSFHLNLKMNSI